MSLPNLPKETLDQSFDQIFGVNVKGPLYGAKALLPELLKTQGNIIFTVSNSGFYPAGGVIINDTSSYCADRMPYGGIDKSGAGREGPRFAVEEMSEIGMAVFNVQDAK